MCYHYCMKKCSACKESKELSLFYKNAKRPDGYQSYCKECNKLWVRNNYRQNKEYFVDRAQQQLDDNAKFVFEYLLGHPCVDCGESDPIVLEFDHVRGEKTLAISTMIQRKWATTSIEKEINKCEVRCANCHRRITATRGGWRRVFLGG